MSKTAKGGEKVRRQQGMSDIVKRLREGRTDGTDLRWSVTDVHLEAAAEIARLRAEVEQRDRMIRESNAGNERVINALRAEVSALRADLAMAREREGATWLEYRGGRAQP